MCQFLPDSMGFIPRSGFMMPESSLSLRRPSLSFDDKLDLLDNGRAIGRVDRFGVVRDPAGFHIGHMKGPGLLRP